VTSPHVLVVEDSALMAGALRVLLEETGHRVTTADTVAGAVAAARADPPDVILLDVTLRGEDGIEVLVRLGDQGARLPVAVAITGHDDHVVHRRCREAGCREVLVKPIAAMELPAKIRDWLGEGAGRTEQEGARDVSDP
jgi:CheY-like chemotaxis protein